MQRSAVVSRSDRGRAARGERHGKAQEPGARSIAPFSVSDTQPCSTPAEETPAFSLSIELEARAEELEEEIEFRAEELEDQAEYLAEALEEEIEALEERFEAHIEELEERLEEQLAQTQPHPVSRKEQRGKDLHQKERTSAIVDGLKTKIHNNTQSNITNFTVE